jgi:hypothetical protein
MFYANNRRAILAMKKGALGALTSAALETEAGSRPLHQGPIICPE